MKSFSIFGLAAALLSAGNAFAAIIVTGDINDGLTLQITAPIHFTTTAPINTGIAVILDNWVETDSSATMSVMTPSIPMLADGVPLAISNSAFYDNTNNDALDVTAGDGVIIFVFDDGQQPVGTLITLPAGVWTIAGNADFNPAILQTFTGDMFLGDLDGNRVSDIVSLVPEPSAALLGAVGALALLKRRR